MKAIYELNPFIKEQDATDVDVLDAKNATLLVWNDDFNTFDWVIESLIEVCDHTHEQAEQCSLLIHYKGKCDVKKGTFDQVVNMRDALIERGLTAEVI